MSEVKTGFFAYAAIPNRVGQTIEAAIRDLRSDSFCTNVTIKSWRELDIVGHFISSEVLLGIDAADFFIADISTLNFNVTYEIGYAIGKGKRILLTKDKSVSQETPCINEVGIFDTLGFKEYENSAELSRWIKSVSTINPISINLSKINTQSPVYILNGQYKTDWFSRILSRIKKSAYIFRSFDPNEQPRLSANDAIKNVSESHGVIVPLVGKTYTNSSIHNMRGAFIAGLATGMGKALTIIQEGDDPVPLDYRDFVSVSYHPDEINDIIAKFAAKVAKSFQENIEQKADIPETFLQSLELGANSAENEMRTLRNYYLKTDQFLKAIRGEAHLVVGRKGSGKSAIFFQIRDRERAKKDNIVLDLKPDGYKLIKFKELVLDFLEKGTLLHTITAFWEYVLLLEICYKILQRDKDLHLKDHTIYETYKKLDESYNDTDLTLEGDFSERMSFLMDKVANEYKAKYGDQSEVRLSVPQLTELLYSHNLNKLKIHVIEYMKHKSVLWLLFDNIDKGWPTSGLTAEDLLIVRALIDATKKIEHQLQPSKTETHTIVFLRNDVYELLVQATSDRGKEASVLLDWTDPELLKELLRLRIASNNLDDEKSFKELWQLVCVGHINGEESSQFLIDRTLMRPRFLLNMISQCKSFAINLRHKIIQEDDIKKGLIAYSADLVSDIGYEINDIAPSQRDILYAFISSRSVVTREEIKTLLLEYGLTEDSEKSIFDILLWYGFIGVILNLEPKYIYNFNYNIKLMTEFIKKNIHCSFMINPAFWPALMIEDNLS